MKLFLILFMITLKIILFFFIFVTLHIFLLFLLQQPIFIYLILFASPLFLLGIGISFFYLPILLEILF